MRRWRRNSPSSTSMILLYIALSLNGALQGNSSPSQLLYLIRISLTSFWTNAQKCRLKHIYPAVNVESLVNTLVWSKWAAKEGLSVYPLCSGSPWICHCRADRAEISTTDERFNRTLRRCEEHVAEVCVCSRWHGNEFQCETLQQDPRTEGKGRRKGACFSFRKETVLVSCTPGNFCKSMNTFGC